jgi:hypothetical protein
MPTQAPRDLYRKDLNVDRAMLGCQDYLYWADASAAQGNNPAGLNAQAPQGQALAMAPLKDLAAMIAGTGAYAGVTVTALAPGTYYAQFGMTGMARPTIDLTATFTGGTCTTTAYSTYKDGQTQRQAFTGTGAMTTATLQTSTLATPNGEAIGVLKIVVGAGGSVTAFTLAELSGQRG